ncbi:hypothetical protein Q7L71_02070 [Conexibacter sp. CPCC 205706]|nr:hypothetical protein [Conexibacter sp. CPCC 205706]
MLATALSTLLIVAGCGEEPLPQACLQADAGAVARLLHAAPEDATLSGGTPLSACVDRAESDAELQNLGIVFVAVADRLVARSRHDARAAYELGFLIGAAERGAGPTGGVQGELVQRLQQTIAFNVTPAVQAEVERGIAAGRTDG